MAAKGDWIEIEKGARAFVSRPLGGEPPWPGLILIHSVIGIDREMRELAESFANEGYFAVVPDLYGNDAQHGLHLQEHIGVAAHMGTDPLKQAEVLSRYSVETQGAILKARAWMSARPTQTYIHTVTSVFEYLEKQPDIREIGAFGFCMGGRLVGELAATGVQLSAGVMHYGSPPKLDQVPQIKGALEGHYASTDTPITGKVPAFAEAMESAGKDFTYYIYEADHGFSLGDSFPAAKHAAMTRSSAFLNRHLLPRPVPGSTKQESISERD